MEGAISLTEIGPTSSGKEATRQFSLVPEFLQQINVPSSHSRTQEESLFHQRCWVTFSFLPLGRSFVFHRGCSLNLTSVVNAGLIAGGRGGREIRQCSVHHTIEPMVYRSGRILSWSHEAQKSSPQNRLEARSKRCLLDPLNQLLSVIRTLQEKVNALHAQKELYDPETASSSGMHHVPREFRVPEVCLAAILDCRTFHEIRWVLQETFFGHLPIGAEVLQSIIPDLGN